MSRREFVSSTQIYCMSARHQYFMSSTHIYVSSTHIFMWSLINILLKLKHQVTVFYLFTAILIYVDTRPSYVSFGPVSHTIICAILPFSLMTVSFRFMSVLLPRMLPNPQRPLLAVAQNSSSFRHVLKKNHFERLQGSLRGISVSNPTFTSRARPHKWMVLVVLFRYQWEQVVSKKQNRTYIFFNSCITPWKFGK